MFNFYIYRFDTRDFTPSGVTKLKPLSLINTKANGYRSVFGDGHYAYFLPNNYVNPVDIFTGLEGSGLVGRIDLTNFTNSGITWLDLTQFDPSGNNFIDGMADS